MREIRLHGSEGGGAETNRSFVPLSGISCPHPATSYIHGWATGGHRVGPAVCSAVGDRGAGPEMTLTSPSTLVVSGLCVSCDSGLSLSVRNGHRRRVCRRSGAVAETTAAAPFALGLVRAPPGGGG